MKMIEQLNIENVKPCYVVHYGEIGTKSGNRGFFENQLRHNIARILPLAGGGAVQRFFGRLIIFPGNSFEPEKLEELLGTVFGISSFSPAYLTELSLEKMTGLAVELMKRVPFRTFKVKTKRSEKLFPMKSIEISAHVGAAIVEATNGQVKMQNPDVTCHIEIFNQRAVVFVEKIPGLGGMPSGSGEGAVAMLSSGIDSPVASWRIMKRGVRLSFVHFHSIPATSPASVDNARKIVEVLTRYQYKSRLYLVPVLPIQDMIRVEAPEEYRIILLRRCMVKMAARIALMEKKEALVTGESVGQVASQTMTNIRVINHGVDLPILRPLSGDDKMDIVAQARKIGTFEISTASDEDCCSLFVPQRPATKANLEEVLMIEKHLPFSKLLDEALENTEVEKFRFPQK